MRPSDRHLVFEPGEPSFTLHYIEMSALQFQLQSCSFPDLFAVLKPNRNCIKVLRCTRKQFVNSYFSSSSSSVSAQYPTLGHHRTISYSAVTYKKYKTVLV